MTHSCEGTSVTEEFSIPMLEHDTTKLPGAPGPFQQSVGYDEIKGLWTINCVEKEEMAGMYVLFQGKHNGCGDWANGFDQLYDNAIGYIPPETQYDHAELYDSLPNEFVGSYTYHPLNHFDTSGDPFKNQVSFS